MHFQVIPKRQEHLVHPLLVRLWLFAWALELYEKGLTTRHPEDPVWEPRLAKNFELGA